MATWRAYIASLGTTGVLVASSVLLLVVVSALLAFRGWPGEGLVDELQSLVVDRDEPALEITGPAQLAADAAPAAAAVAAAPAGSATAEGPTAGGGRGPAPGDGTDGGTFTPRSDPPSSGGGGGGGGGIAGTGTEAPTVGGVTGDVGDTTQALTSGLGNAVGGTSPELGQQVTETGEALSELVRDLGIGVEQQQQGQLLP